MRFEVAAAFIVGFLLPVLETVRRGFGHWAIHTTTMLEDYLAGALLLTAALTSTRGAAFSQRLLLIAWSGVSTMMTISLVSQIEDTIRAVAIEANNNLVLAFKLLLWLISITALIRTFRNVPRSILR